MTEPTNTAPTRTPRPWSGGGLRGWAVEPFDTFDPLGMPWAEARAKHPLPGTVALAKRSRSRIVLRTNHAGESIYVKRAVARTVARRVSQRILGPKTRREAEVLRAFRAAGVIVPEAVFYAEAPDGVTYLATRAFPAAWENLDAAFADGIDEVILAETAVFARWLHDHGGYHADFRTDHIYRTGLTGATGRFALLDLDGSAMMKRVPAARRARALDILFVSLMRRGFDPGHASSFLAAYDPGAELGFDARTLYHDARRRHLAAV